MLVLIQQNQINHQNINQKIQNPQHLIQKTQQEEKVQ